MDKATAFEFAATLHGRGIGHHDEILQEPLSVDQVGKLLNFFIGRRVDAHIVSGDIQYCPPDDIQN